MTSPEPCLGANVKSWGRDVLVAVSRVRGSGRQGERDL